MMFRLHALLRGHWLVAGCAMGMFGALGAQTVGPVADRAPAGNTEELHPMDDPVVKLDAVEVSAGLDDPEFDGTGMGSYEHQLRETPFWNDMISIEALEDDPAAAEVAAELAAIAAPSAVDLATGDSRVGLRGFPTPQMSNGFVRMGGIDFLNTARTIVIQGALVPVLGRAAPGGIQDVWTNRPRTSKARRFDYSISSLERQTASLEINGPAVPKRVWHRIATSWSRKTGPETFAASEVRSVSGAVTWRHSSAASTLFSVDYLQTHATSAPGIPEYRVATGQKIVGPYLPLAGFNALGPEAGIRRRSMVANILLDAQPHPRIALRASVEAWWRRIEQDRFTTGLLNLGTGRFEGTREPRHSEQPQSAQVARAEATARFAALRGEHKLMLAASHTMSDYLREERALSPALRNALPASVRFFDPAAPDYFRPPYDPESYSRIITDRREHTRYTALELSERMGVANGRAVFTTGLRQDFVRLRLDDRRVGLPPDQAKVSDAVHQLTYHFGANYQAIPSRLLLFATSSTAFNPSTRVDVRTGRIQGNATTRGHEGGLKARFAKPRIELTTALFAFFNQDISRRNPLYNDPVLDADDLQPQLVAAGEERFTGGKIEGRWKPIAPMTLSLRGTYVRAITTASPDLPEEVGREITRFPPFNLSAGASYGFSSGQLRGLSLSASCSYISDFVAQYEDAQRQYLEYPGYMVASLSTSYSKRIGKRTHGFGLAVRNLLNEDLLAKLARLGAGREVSASYRLMW